MRVRNSITHSRFQFPNSKSQPPNSEFQIPHSKFLIPSSARQIAALIADLSSPNDVARESAVARLSVIGPRAVDRLIRIVQSQAAASVRAAAVRALEAIDDPRSLAAALKAMNDSEVAVAIPAINIARRWLYRQGSADVVDRLITVAIDRARAVEVRVSALRVLGDLDRQTIAPLLKSLARDQSAVVRAEVEASRGRRRARSNPVEILTAAADQTLPGDPDTVGRAIVTGGAEVPVTVLLRIVERVRGRESGLPPAARARWSNVRAAAHVALANRSSRLGLYDLREALEAANDMLPVAFLTALSRVGDASCLSATARAHARSHDKWFRERLADAFRTIVKRERLTPRHAVMKKIRGRWPESYERLIG